MLRIPSLLLLAGLLSAQERETAPPPDIPKLLRLLETGTPSQRASAAEQLGRGGIKGAVRPLMVALRYEDSRVQDAALVALNTLGDTRAAPEIRRFLHSPNGSLRMMAAMTLLHFRDEASLGTILDFLENPDPQLRREAGRMFMFVPIPEAVPALEAALEDEDLQVRLNAVRALGMIRDPESEPKMAALLLADQESLRTAALMSLASTAPQNYKETLLDLFRNSPQFKRRVVAPLARLQVPEVESLIMSQSPGAPILNFYHEPEISEKLRATRLMIREIRWMNLEEIAQLIAKRTGLPVEISPSLPGDPTEIRLANLLGPLGYMPETFAILNSIGPQYWVGISEAISFIIDDGKVVLVPVPEAERFFRERAEKRGDR